MIVSRTTANKFIHRWLHHSFRNRNPSFSQVFPRAIILPPYRSCGRSFAQFHNFQNSTSASITTIAPGIHKSNMTALDNLNNSNTRRMTTHVSSHYESHSKEETYDEAFFYEPGAYMEHLVRLVGKRLGLHRLNKNNPRTLLDIGGGTGTFARALLAEGERDRPPRFASDYVRIVVVDPFLEQAKGDNGSSNSTQADQVSFVRAPAEDFMFPSNNNCWRSQLVGGYDQILLKEVVHHFDAKDRVSIFKGMREGINTNINRRTSLLIVTRPQTDIDYPLWDAARKVWKENQPSVQELSKDLLMSGFTNIQSTIETYQCSISLARWQNMVRTRCWSTFSNFSDAELEHACDIIARDAKANPRNRVVDGETMLEFDDRLVFLQARAEIRIPFHVQAQ